MPKFPYQNHLFSTKGLTLWANMGREKVFRFKQFAVLNNRTAMKVGTDGVLLGAWCPVEGVGRVLDVGTGCGVIALMIAQRNSQAIISGIDIDQNAIDEARINFDDSPWGDRLTAIECDFNKMPSVDRYDLIGSNPPYFTDSLLPPDKSRTTARHTQFLSYHQLIDGATRRLADNGSIALISPIEAEREIIEAATFSSIPVKQITRVVSKSGTAPKRILWRLTHASIPYQEDTLTIADHKGQFTSEYIALTRDFYLKM